MARSELRVSTRPFGGYDVTRSKAVDEELTNTDKGTACGEYLRRAWQPLCLTSELGDKPLAITVLGESLVLFRDLSGRLGLLHRNCSHRGASLEYGLITADGIRCAYHGWHYGVDGVILQAPAESAPGAMAKRLCQGAYPVRECEGLIFAYLGPLENVPEFPIYDFMNARGEERIPYRWTLPTNWQHVRENAQDPIHLTFLHSMFGVKQFGDFTPQIPYIRSRRTPLGVITSSIRRMGDEFYFRINEMILPNVARIPDIPAWDEAVPANLCDFLAPGAPRALRYKRQIPASHGLGITIYVVPHDNLSCQMIGWIHVDENEDPAVTEMGLRQLRYGQVQDRPYAERQANPGDGDVLVSQGPHYSSENDNLTVADAGVVLYRRLLRAEIRSRAGRNEQSAPVLAAPGNSGIRTFGYSIFRPAPNLGTEAEELRHRGRLEAELVERILAGTLEQTGRVLEPVERTVLV